MSEQWEILSKVLSDMPYASLFWVLAFTLFYLVRRCKSWSDDE